MGSYVPATIGKGPVGTARSAGVCILLSIVTRGICDWFWDYSVHEEMKRHSCQGLGGLYKRRRQPEPVTTVPGLWALLHGWFFLIGYIVWFVKTNEALNEYWRSLGAV